MLMDTVTQLGTKTELYQWENRPFVSSSSWHQPSTLKTNKCEVIKRIIGKKPKRNRTIFTTDQLNLLEDVFAKQPYIGTQERHKLAKRVNIGEKQIKVWFQNRRMKEKRKSCESSDTYSETSMQSPGTNKSEAATDVNISYTYDVPLENATRTNSEYQLPAMIPTYANNDAIADFFDHQYQESYNMDTHQNIAQANTNAYVGSNRSFNDICTNFPYFYDLDALNEVYVNVNN